MNREYLPAQYPFLRMTISQVRDEVQKCNDKINEAVNEFEEKMNLDVKSISQNEYNDGEWEINIDIQF